MNRRSFVKGVSGLLLPSSAVVAPRVLSIDTDPCYASMARFGSQIRREDLAALVKYMNRGNGHFVGWLCPWSDPAIAVMYDDGDIFVVRTDRRVEPYDYTPISAVSRGLF